MKEPERPATRFSFSPRMRAPLISSSSLTRPVPAFVTLNVVRPASIFSVAGSQPASVSLISTWRPPAAEAPLESLPQPVSTTATSTSTAATLATWVTWARAGRRARAGQST